MTFGITAGEALIFGGTIGASAIAANSSTSTNQNVIQGPQEGISTTNQVQTLSTLNPETVQKIRELITSNQYSKSAALADSRKAALAAGQKVIQTNMPVIAANEKNAGIMGDTMTTQLATNTFAEAAVTGAATQMGAVNDYASQLAQLVNSLAAGTPKTTKSTEAANSATTPDTPPAPPPSSGGGGMCFITTAVCAYLGKPDDCEELTILRAFRDGYMRSTGELDTLVQQYYQEAPDIVAKLDKLTADKKSALYGAFNKVYILPAVAYIKRGMLSAALETYKELFEAAKSKAANIEIGE